MKKEVKLFDKRFVHFMWDDELKGKKCFVANYIGALRSYVEKGNERYFEVERSNDTDEPFQAKDGLMFSFAYYDPNYEVKKAFNEGKTIQYLLIGGVDWGDIDSEEALECRITEGRTFRIKPEEKDWIAYLARENDGSCYLSACTDAYWESAQKEFGAKTKLFIGTHDEVSEWYKSREKFKDLIKAWEDGDAIQIKNGRNYWDEIKEPGWGLKNEYRVKPECPCKDGIDSKACVGCEHSEDGKKKYRPYESSAEMIVDFIDRFKVNCPSYCEPLIWVKDKENDSRHLVTSFVANSDDGSYVVLFDYTCDLYELFNDYTYLDGSPVGMEMKE